MSDADFPHTHVYGSASAAAFLQLFSKNGCVAAAFLKSRMSRQYFSKVGCVAALYSESVNLRNLVIGAGSGCAIQPVSLVNF